ncbi:MAG: single-stranded-DNA-specific exonuclease RecJ [Ktedonobacteraceae bacterium]
METASPSSDVWEVYPRLSAEQFSQCQQAGIEPLQAQLLYNRGVITPRAMRAFLDARYDQTPDPHLLIAMDRALERIQRALAEREHITVYGDYDADGVTSAALLTRALRALAHPDAAPDSYIPHRLREGVGLNLAAINTLHARETTLIITTDCASSDVAQVAYANSLGIDVIITDHHHPPEQLPPAYAVINPWRADCAYPERYLCGAGIAFKLAQALYRAHGRSIEEEQDLLDLVAIGTIADLAPLLGENHTLARLGLEKMSQTRKPGLRALMQRANVPIGRIRERDIAYAIAPRINAAGRMKDASVAFELLTTDDPATAARCVEELESLNLSRQRQTEELMNAVRGEARQRPADAVILVSGENWPEGIIGLAAGRLVEEFGRPVLVLSRGAEFSRGSARSPRGFDLIAALQARDDLFVRFGGHTQAAGFTIANERVEDLRSHLLGWLVQNGHAAAGANAVMPDPTGIVTEEETPGALLTTPPRMVDLVFTKLHLLNAETFKKIQQLFPFGAGNPDPTFKIAGLRIINSWLGGSDGRHLNLLFGANGFQQRGTLLGGGTRRASLPIGQPVNIIFRLESSNGSLEEFWWKILDVETIQ